MDEVLSTVLDSELECSRVCCDVDKDAWLAGPSSCTFVCLYSKDTGSQGVQCTTCTAV